MAALKWGSSGDKVAELQKTLTDLGYYTGPVNGRFGPMTHMAVKAFQRKAGLVVDGIVGEKTWAALAASATAPAGGTSGGTALLMSLHIGLNRVDPARYGGWNGALAGCENDARTMTTIAEAEGFSTRQLFTAQATTGNVLAAIADAAQQLTSGGTFLLTYAGHGGQVSNANGEADPESDQLDETWVLYDRQLLDDEVDLALSGFAPGVDIVMLSDSCHSGTVYRPMEHTTQLEFAELKRAFYADLAVARPGPDADDATTMFPRPRAVGPATRSRAAGSPGQTTTPAAISTREMPLGINLTVNQIQAEELFEAKENARGAGSNVRANALLISGCQDNQLSQEVGGRGVFTTAVERAWAANGFAGTYTAFHQAVLSQMGPTQTPMLSLFGADPASLAARTPFNV